jgi:hypothetical protein
MEIHHRRQAKEGAPWKMVKGTPGFNCASYVEGIRFG